MVFGPTSTADDVLGDLNLAGKRVLITGVSSGIGLEMARAVAERGASVVGTVRDLKKGEGVTEAFRTTSDLQVVKLDLESLESVRAISNRLVRDAEKFDVIIANAGVMAVPFARTVDGYETHFAINHLGHFLLVNLLSGLFQEGGRLVMVSSAGHRGADVDLNDPSFERTPYDPLVAYRRSKTATILFALAFDRRHRTRGIRATAVHPGAVVTETTRRMIEAEPSAASAFTWKTVAQGAATPIWAAFVAPADDVGGRYAEDCHLAEVNDDPTASVGVRSYALDAGRAEALWLKSLQMVGEHPATFG